MNTPTLTKQDLFWDVELATLDIQAHARFIIERILRFGDDDDVRWMQTTYTDAVICEALAASRSLDPKSRLFWSFIYNQPCSNRPSERIQSAFSQR